MTQRLLLLDVQELLSQPADVRINFAQQDCWVPYPEAKKMLDRMDRLYAAPLKTRTKSMLVVGKPNAGKTSLKNRFLDKYPAIEAPDGSRTIYGVLHIEAPPKADPRAFCMAILDALGASYGDVSFAVLSNQVLKLLRETGVKMLVVDEIHNFLTGRRDMKEALMNLIRSICNVRHISVIAFGIPSAQGVFVNDAQLSSRFKRYELPVWNADKKLGPLRQMLASLEQTLPLQKASNLSQKVMAEKIAGMSEGILGEVVDILEEATIEAIETGEELITVDLLDSLGLMTPTEREEFRIDD
jgi:hypothetical protein